MACFLIPMALAIITSIVQRGAMRLAERLRLWVLNTLLWGGVILLALEHLWHGEVVPWPPFLTAMANPVDIPAMLHEMATAGTAISAATIATWGAILTVSHYKQRVVSLKAIERFKEVHLPS